MRSVRLASTADVTGDGLPDYVRKSSTDARFHVHVNDGYGFGPEEQWAAPGLAERRHEAVAPERGDRGGREQVCALRFRDVRDG